MFVHTEIYTVEEVARKSWLNDSLDAIAFRPGEELCCDGVAFIRKAM